MSGPEKLRVGMIAYANLYPIYYMLQELCDCSGYDFIEGVPSGLNRSIRSGEIDVSPSSSIEYLRHSRYYEIIEDHSISSIGPVRSIFLFSRLPIGELNGATVNTSSHSETSVALLRIVLEKFYKLDCLLETTSDPLEKTLERNPAALLIGDEAILESRKQKSLFQYDLGELWYKNTGLPMTFALWIVRKGCCEDKAELVEKLKSDLDRSKTAALKSLDRIASACPLSRYMPQKELVAYWKGISYDFGDQHKRGFDLFRTYLEELAIL